MIIIMCIAHYYYCALLVFKIGLAVGDVEKIRKEAAMKSKNKPGFLSLRLTS